MQRTIIQDKDQGNLIVFEDIELNAGPTMVEAWNEHEGIIYAPIYVEVYKE